MRPGDPKPYKTAVHDPVLVRYSRKVVGIGCSGNYSTPWPLSHDWDFRALGFETLRTLGCQGFGFLVMSVKALG